MKKIHFLLIILGFSSIQLAQAQKNNYKVLNTIALEGDAGCDYLVADDATAKLLSLIHI